MSEALKAHSKGISQMGQSTTSFRMADVPMAADRTAGWAFFREHGDVFESNGTYFLVSADAVQFAHRHPEIFTSGPAFESLGSPVPLVPLAIDPPDHLRFRKVLDPMLAPRVINTMEDELRAQVRELIQAFAGRGECDIVTDLARLYPTQVFLTLFGMPLADRDMFIGWVEALVEQSTAESGREPTAEVVETAMALFGYLQRFIERKRAEPGADLLSKILAVRGEDAWTDEQILGLCFLFTLAGLDTVTATIGFVMMHLAKNPEVRQRLVDDPAMVGPTIEEILRLELPAPYTPRVTSQEVEVAGVVIPAGSMVQLCLGTANRDPRRYERPNEIGAELGDRGHLSFGGGIHRCLGSHLARRELRLVVEEFHRVIPDYEIAPGVEPEIVWPSGTHHLISLPLRFTPAEVKA